MSGQGAYGATGGPAGGPAGGGQSGGGYGGRPMMGGGMMGGAGRGAGGGEDQQRQRRFVQDEQLDDGIPVMRDENGEKVYDPVTGAVVLDGIIGEDR